MRRKRKRDIIIELTSLLDVIMIMIFMVMAENSKLISEKQTALESAQTENAAASAELDELTDKADALSTELEEALGKLNEGNAEELLEKLQAAESRLDAYKYMDDIVIVLNIGLENKYSNTVRCLSFGNAAEPGGTTVCEIRSGGELTEAINRMKVFLTEYAARAAADESNSIITYMIFSYDTRNIYQDDYAAVDEALNSIEHKANSGNVRYRLDPLNDKNDK